MKTIALLVVVLLCISCEPEDVSTPGNLVPRTVMEDTSLPSIGINGTQLHSVSFGDPADPLVIFLHGGPGGDYANALGLQQLADDGYHIVFYDQRGSGLSQRHDKASYSIDLMLDDLSAVIAHFRSSESQQVFLIGHSWGGMLAAAYINAHPDAISGCVFAEPGGLTKAILDDYAENSRKLKPFSEATNDVLYPEQMLNGKENSHEILDYNLAISTSYSYAKENGEGIEGPSPFRRYGAVVLNAFVDIAEDEGFDFTSNLHQYAPSVLFLYGGNNKAYGLEMAQREANFFTSASIQEIEGTGHEMIYFQTAQVVEAIRNYLHPINN